MRKFLAAALRTLATKLDPEPPPRGRELDMPRQGVIGTIVTSMKDAAYTAELGTIEPRPLRPSELPRNIYDRGSFRGGNYL